MPKDKSSSSRAFVLSSLASQRKSRPSPSTSTSILKPTSTSSSTNPLPSKGKKIRADALSWKTVSLTSPSSSTQPALEFDANEGGMLFLEEVEGVDVVWEEREDGRRRAMLVEAEEGGTTSGSGKGKKRKRGVDGPAEKITAAEVETLIPATTNPNSKGELLELGQGQAPEIQSSHPTTTPSHIEAKAKLKPKSKAKTPREKAKEKRERFAAKAKLGDASAQAQAQAGGGYTGGGDGGGDGDEVIEGMEVDEQQDGERDVDVKTALTGSGKSTGESRAERLKRIEFDSKKLPGWSFLTTQTPATALALSAEEEVVGVKTEPDLEPDSSTVAEAEDEDMESSDEINADADADAQSITSSPSSTSSTSSPTKPDTLIPSPPTQPLHPLIQSALYNLKFHQPTDIQKRGIPIALEGEGERRGGRESGGGRDVVGVAETGSGKTLAYSIPIIQHILHTIEDSTPTGNSSASEQKKRELSALILCPTRELALQVGKVINEFIAAGERSLYPSEDADADEEQIEGGEIEAGEGEEDDEGNDEAAERAAMEAEAAARFAGGKYKSSKGKGKGKGKGAEKNNKSKEQEKQKQQQLQRQKQKQRAEARSGPRPPPIISAATVVGGLSAMKQKRLVARGCDILVATPGRLWDLCEEDDNFASQIKGLRFLVIDEADRMIETGHFAELENIVDLTARAQNAPVTTNAAEDDPTFARVERKVDKTRVREDMQTFVFSATLSKDLQANLKRGWQRRGKGKKVTNTLDDLFDKLDFRDEKPEVIDISPEGRLVATLRESLIESVTSDKDLYLYYFLLRYPGRSLVFTSSIDGIRRLVPLFEMLKVPVYPLHSQLQQKQRLKNLDRFASSPSGVLIATDVAARGLDIPSVDHVIHFQLPRSADAYIHRSGRTARAKQDGFSLQMVSPEERSMQRNLMKSLGRTPDLPELPIEPGFLPKLRERIRVAKDIEKAQHQVKKVNHDKNWLKEVADAMDLDIDPDLLSDDDEEAQANKARGINVKNTSSAKVANLKAELDHLLKQPLMARGVSARYPTSGTRVVVEDLLGSKGQPVMLGASSAKAFEDIDTRPTKKRKFIKRKVGTK